MANRKQNKQTGRFVNNIVKVEDAKDYAEGYYDKHQKTIDKILDGKTTRNKKDVFVDLVEDLYSQNRVQYNNKSDLNEGIHSIMNELQGNDPNLNKIKRDALNREEAGFGDLRKLNKRLSGKETAYHGPDNIVGYFDIKNSDYVIVHKLDYTWSATSPMDIYEYETRVNAGL